MPSNDLPIKSIIDACDIDIAGPMDGEIVERKGSAYSAYCIKFDHVVYPGNSPFVWWSNSSGGKYWLCFRYYVSALLWLQSYRLLAPK